MNRQTFMIAVVLGWTAIQAGHAKAKPVAAAASVAPQKKVDLAVYPEKIDLSRGDDFQSVIAVLTRDDGVTVDVTSSVDWTFDKKDVAAFSNAVVRPAADGQTNLVAKYLGGRVVTPVTVVHSDQRPPVSFVADVMPVLTRAGCNTGSCHGAARGKDGFRLSLFGFDPTGDYNRITREIGFRRINLALPDESLLLQKSIGAVPHTGGKLFNTDSDLYKTLHRWLQQGAKLDSGKDAPAEVVSLELLPKQAVIEGDSTKQSLVAIAHLADGHTRDVTDLAAYTTSNAGSATIDVDGSVAAASRGEAFVTARFGVHTVGSQILTLPESLKYQPQPIDPDAGRIDRLVNEKLRLLRIEPSPSCDDETFLRRVTIDICGLLPTEEAHRKFVADPAEDKRERLIDSLLERKEFSEIWAMKFAQILMIKSNNQISYKSAYLYANWLTDQFAREVPFDQIVKQLIVASGGTFTNPPTNFYEMERDTLKTSENVAQVFMGIRTQCAQCHNHPFDRWTMNDYYGFASFFTQIGRKPAEDYRENIVFNKGGGEFKHPVDGKPVPPKFLGGGPAETKGKDRRLVVADWLVSKDNPYFAPSIANRVWAHFMGVGNVHPVDDVRVSNPPSNPALFEALGEQMVTYDFNLKSLVREICNSDAYQRSAETNASNAHDHRNYAHAVIRRIPAESLLDCVGQITGVPDKYRGLPLGARAVQIADGTTSTYFLDTFGRSPRATACECEATTGPSLSQALHLLNGDAVQKKIVRSKQVETWLKTKKLSAADIVAKIYVTALSRSPTPAEREDIMTQYASLEGQADQVAYLQDVYWAVLNSSEFVFNH